MSTHGTLTIEYPDHQRVTFYRHADGDYLAATIAAGLDRGRARWDDAPYLARILFAEMIRDDVDGLLGYGILPGDAPAGSSYSYTVDVDAGTVNGQTFQAFIEEHGGSRVAGRDVQLRQAEAETIATSLGNKILDHAPDWTAFSLADDLADQARDAIWRTVFVWDAGRFEGHVTDVKGLTPSDAAMVTTSDAWMAPAE